MNANSTWRIRYCPGSAFLGNSYDGCRYIHGGGDTVFFFWGDTAVWAAKYVANLAGDTLRLTYLEGKDFFIDLLEQSGIKEWTFVKLGSAVIPCD
jgi:hypothetical protein